QLAITGFLASRMSARSLSRPGSPMRSRRSSIRSASLAWRSTCFESVSKSSARWETTMAMGREGAYSPAQDPREFAASAARDPLPAQREQPPGEDAVEAQGVRVPAPREQGQVPGDGLDVAPR